VSDDAQLLVVEDLRVTFREKFALRGARHVQAVSEASFEIASGETLGLVGESGSGKSTTARAILRLVEPNGGTITWRGRDITKVPKREMRALRGEMQMIFQDPYSSLDPSMTIANIVAEPLRVNSAMSQSERYERVAEELVHVGLSSAHMQRYSYEFSGGQRQRISIARALILKPRFLVCDEIVSALDVSTQGQILNLLLDLQEESGISLLFITHNLAVVRRVSQRIAVMYLGEIVEVGPSERVYNAPAHPYTQALLSAILETNLETKKLKKSRIVLAGEMPDPASPPAGCRFHTRCPQVMDICRRERPVVTTVSGGGSVSCHLYPSSASGNNSGSTLGASVTLKPKR